MKRLSLIVGITALLQTGAFAQPRPLTTGMTCHQTKSLVTGSGAIVLSTGQHTYDRYVRSQAFCLQTEFAQPAWVPTADIPQCFVGYTCVDEMPLSSRSGRLLN
ncbi:hypothetical protein AA309_15680 [Microvirga vignae]|uniref:Secreted protein n=2 Tax=Microvirga vignae TaxID=1225564 RepID=A0A0H1RHU6_9HYPH|nr:hypothetical protein AA309_15680 [Microvirga vignae]